LSPSIKISPTSLQIESDIAGGSSLCCCISAERLARLSEFDSGLVTQGHLIDVEPSYTRPNAKTISVRAVRLDDYTSENWPTPQFLKIDVEGGADAVFAGAQTLLALHRTTIYIELHGPEEQKAVRELLAKSGYQAQTLSGEEVSDPTAGWFSPLVCRPR
jgi:hypothetical protein